MVLERRDSPELDELALHLAEARIKRRQSQAELAARCALTQTQISYFEAGKRRPTLDQFFRLARALDVSIQSLISGSNLPGTSLRDIAFELRHLGIVDLWIEHAAVPGAFRRPEELIPLTVAAQEPDPRILGALPAVLAWNTFDPVLLRAYALSWNSRTARRLAWLADIALAIQRKGGFPDGSRTESLARFVRIVRPPSAEQNDWDSLERPSAALPTSPQWIRWRINYDAGLADFENRAKHLTQLRKQSEHDSRPGWGRVSLRKRGNDRTEIESPGRTDVESHTTRPRPKVRDGPVEDGGDAE